MKFKFTTVKCTQYILTTLACCAWAAAAWNLLPPCTERLLLLSTLESDSLKPNSSPSVNPRAQFYHRMTVQCHSTNHDVYLHIMYTFLYVLISTWPIWWSIYAIFYSNRHTKQLVNSTLKTTSMYMHFFVVVQVFTKHSIDTLYTMSLKQRTHFFS